MTVCQKCFADKQEDSFYKHKKRASGLQPWCKDCQRSRDRKASNADYYKRKVVDAGFRERRSEYGKAHYVANKATLNARMTIINKRWRKAHPEEFKARIAKAYAALKSSAFAKLGDHCASCGFSDARALQIDHVQGGGTKARKTNQSIGVYRAVIRGEPGEFQLLCATCNWLKRLGAKDYSALPRYSPRVLRLRVIEHLGGCCARCDERRAPALHIDHANGGGNQERKAIGHGTAYYKKMLASPAGVYQLLCANCNWIKKSETASERPGPKLRLSA